MTNINAMIYDYKQKLEEYRKTLGILPTDIKESLLQTIRNSQDEDDIKFVQKCLQYLDYTTKTFSNPETILDNEKDQEWAKIYSQLHYQIASYEDMKGKCEKLVQEFPRKLIEEILFAALTNPTSENDAYLCKNFSDYLYRKVKLAQAKEQYRQRLETEQTTIDKLKELGISQGTIEILQEPQTAEEIDFCNSFLNLQNSIQAIRQAKEEGTAKPGTIHDFARKIDTSLFEPNTFQTPFDPNYSSASYAADLLYDLAYANIVERDTFIKILQKKYPQASVSELDNALQNFTIYIQEQLIKDISRDNKHFNQKARYFSKVEDEFTKLTETGNVYKPEANKKPKSYQQKRLPSWHIYG